MLHSLALLKVKTHREIGPRMKQNPNSIAKIIPLLLVLTSAGKTVN